MTETTKTQEETGQPVKPNLRRFLMVRTEDETGVSGTGIVAEGVQFANGWCVLSWLTRYSSIGVYPNIEEVILIHGHDGRTLVQWCGDLSPSVS
jgi:hypothetical protein